MAWPAGNGSKAGRTPFCDLHGAKIRAQGAPPRETAAGADPGRAVDRGSPCGPALRPPAPVDPDTPGADIRVGTHAARHRPGTRLPARRAQQARHPPGEDLQREDQHPYPVRPQFAAALAVAREIKAHAPHCRVIFTVYEMKRLGRDAAELTALADHLTAHGLVLDMLAGPLQGMYDQSGPGRLLFAYLRGDGADRAGEHPRVDAGRARHRGPQGQTRRPATGHHRRRAAHRAAAPCGRRVCRADPARPDHPHRQARARAPASPASIGPSPSTGRPRRTPRPSRRRTPTSRSCSPPPTSRAPARPGPSRRTGGS